MISFKRIALFSITIFSVNSYAMRMTQNVNMVSFTNTNDQVTNITSLNGKSIDQVKQEAQQGNAPAMFKYSAALFDQKNIEQGVFWYNAGIIRTRQDVSCSTDASVSAAPGAIQMQMANYLCNNQAKQIQLTQFKKAFAYIVQMTEETTLPSPDWVEEHGMAKMLEMFGGEKKNTLLPESLWKEKRLAVLQQYREAIVAQK